jgi:hypothetical protein
MSVPETGAADRCDHSRRTRDVMVSVIGAT